MNRKSVSFGWAHLPEQSYDVSQKYFISISDKEQKTSVYKNRQDRS